MTKKSKLLLLVLGTAILIAGYTVLHALPTGRSFMGIPIGPFGYSMAPKIGRFNGVQLAIPANYIEFAFKYGVFFPAGWKDCRSSNYAPHTMSVDQKNADSLRYADGI